MWIVRVNTDQYSSLRDVIKTGRCRCHVWSESCLEARRCQQEVKAATPSGGEAENQQQLMAQQQQQQMQGGMPGQEEELSAIERFCTDGRMSEERFVGPLVGRDDELRRAIHVLSRRTKK